MNKASQRVSEIINVVIELKNLRDQMRVQGFPLWDDDPKKEYQRFLDVLLSKYPILISRAVASAHEIH